MIALISPAKNLDFESPYQAKTTRPRLLHCAQELIGVLRKHDPAAVQALMNVSEKLATLNVERYHSFEVHHHEKNAKPAVFAFNGDVYRGLKAETFDDKKLQYAQKHLRILSGLYGLLRPLDLIQPYRLEMGTRLAFDDYKTLYDFWGDKILRLLLEDLKEQGDDIILNLASNEYFKSLKRKEVKARIIDFEFLDFKNGTYKTISFYAKRARGLMSRFIIEHKLQNPEDLSTFDYEGYYYDKDASSDNKFVFKRDIKDRNL